MSIETMIANLRNAAWTKKGATIGGGKFSPDECKAAADALASPAGRTVWIVQGEHWNCPGVPISAHASLDAANIKAAELVNVMLKDTGDVVDKPRGATPSDWRGVPMGWLQDYHGAAHCWVEVCELSVEA